MSEENIYRNSFCDLLSIKGRKLVDEQLEKLRCKKCNTPLERITYMEGEVIYCQSKDWHDTGYTIDEWNAKVKESKDER